MIVDSLTLESIRNYILKKKIFHISVKQHPFEPSVPGILGLTGNPFPS